MSTLHIKGGRVIDPANNIDEVRDIFSVDGRIVATLSQEQKDQAEVMDASGKIVAPGLVDIHVHFREPGQTHKEDIRTGTRAAAAGGFTTCVCMPNTSPVCDNAGTIQLIQDSIARNALVNVFPTGCITIGMKGENLAPIGSLKNAGAIAITDDGLCVQDNQLMRKALEYCHMFGLSVMDHCQDVSLTRGSVMNEGEVSVRLGLTGWPAAAEDLIVSRNIILSRLTGAHIHMQHISSAGSVELLRQAKKEGVNVTGEAMPHHMALTDECLAAYDANFKMNPPLRTEADRQAVIEGLLDGALDIIATDHAPHTDYEKDVELDQAPFGIIGLETCLAVCLDVLYRTNKASLSDIIAWLTHKPAKVLDLTSGTLSDGVPADICIFDPDEKWTVSRDTLHGRSTNSPWLGKELQGRILSTFVNGKKVFENNTILDS